MTERDATEPSDRDTPAIPARSAMRELAGNTSLLMLARTLSMGLVFLAGVVAARMYSPVIRGEYAMMTTIAAFAMTLTNFGIGEGLIHFLNKGGADLKRTVTVAFTGSAVVLLFNLIIGLLIVPLLATAYFPEAGRAGAALALFAGAMAVVHRNGYSIWIARRRFAPAAIAITLQPILFFVVLLWAWSVGASLEELTRGFAITWGIAALLVVVPLLRNFSPRTLDRDFLLHFGRFISRSYMSVVFTLLNYRLDMFVVAYLAPDLSMVAYYHVAATVSALLWMIPDSLGPALFPSLSSASSLSERSTTTIGAIRHVVVAVSVCALGLALVAPWLIEFAFGPDYASAVIGIWILLPGVIAMSIVKVLMRFLMSIERHGISVIWSAIGTAICVAGDWVLVPLYGMPGAAIASTVSYVIVACGMLLAFRRLAEVPAGTLHAFPASEFRAYWRTARRLIQSRIRAN